jgi:pimeloyl-ACP methyl ester carboxylesterase
MPPFRRVVVAAAVITVPIAAAYRFALVYRRRAGVPRPRLPAVTPADLGMPYEPTVIKGDGGPLPAWFIPARDGEPGPAVLLVHGWESARDRTLPNAQFLHAAGFHILTFDVRGHGANPRETLPVSGGEFGADATAALREMLARPEVTEAAILGHSMGGIGALLAAADPRVRALVVVSAPADPVRLTRQTFQLARLPFPGPVAWPLAWLTARVFVRPRHHRLTDISSLTAARRYAGPLLLVHGEADSVIPMSHHERLVESARSGRALARAPGAATVETLIVGGGGHSFLHEDEGFRRNVASFLARALGGPFSPAGAADRAAAVPADRIPEQETGFSALQRADMDPPATEHGAEATVVAPGAPVGRSSAPPTVRPGEPAARAAAR